MSVAIMPKCVAEHLRSLVRVVGVALIVSCIGAPLTQASSPAEAVSGEPGAHAISANHDRHSSDLRAGQQVELVTTEQRAIVRLGGHAAGMREQENDAPGAMAHVTPRWCDLVQCRRLAGALLLDYATPPPARLRG